MARRVVDEICLDPHHGFYASPAHDWGESASATGDELTQVVAGPAARILPAHDLFLAGVTSKGASSTTTVPLHQDWTYTDERRERVVFLWCPLVDVEERTGSLSVIPGSHRWSDGIRPSRLHEAAGSIQALLQPLAVSTRLRAGQAIAFDPAVLHGSGPNHSDRLRPAITMALAPADAQLVHFHQAADGEVRGFCVDRDFFTAHEYGAPPTGAAEFPVYGPVVSEAELRRRATRRRHRTGWRRAFA